MEERMVEPPDPKLVKLVQQLDAERAEKVHYRRAAAPLKGQNSQLRRQIQRLTCDHAAVVNRANRKP
jgi:hypothetical protein